MYCKCVKIREESVEYCRTFVEKVFDIANFNINRYTITFENEKHKSITKSLLYTSNKKGKLDAIQLNSCSLMIFNSPDLFADVWDNQMCLFLSPKKDDTYILRKTWTLEDYDEEEFLSKINVFRTEIQKCFTIRYLVVGCMAPEKEVDLFVLGFIKDSHTELENRVARNIKYATYADHRMPYLFPYTYCAGADETWSFGTEERKTVLFRSLISKPIEHYKDSVEWNKYFDILVKEDLILVP